MVGLFDRERLPPARDPCLFCRDLIPGTPHEDRGEAHRIISVVDLRLVQSRATRGCTGCLIIERALSYLSPGWRDYASGSGCLKCDAAGFRRCREGDCSKSAFALLQLGHSIEVCYPFRILDDLAAGAGRTLELFVHDGIPVSAASVYRAVHEDSSAQDWSVRLLKAKEWVETCRIHHSCEGGLGAKADKIANEAPADGAMVDSVGDELRTAPLRPCSVAVHADASVDPESGRPPRLPRRVLDLRRFSNEGKLSLLESEGMRGAYVCLSYTWGPKNNAVTTPDNLRANLDNILYDQLPQTYKDAITVTTAFGVPFLWIDGLCIIQGDRDSADWKEQSSQMAEIYGSSLLVIAAANCTSVEDGFLSAASPSRSLIEFGLPRDADDRPVVYARAMPDHGWLGWSTLAEPKTEGTLSRSWCFQEEVLAPRLLTFYGGEMNLQCLDSEYRCECGFPGASLGLVTIKELYEPRLRLSDSETPNWMWQSTVEHYTRRRLTVPADRLVALSGVARVAQAALRTRYVAGHWWDPDFLCSLCWAPVRTEETERAFSEAYVAPSWSWASHNGPVTMWIPYAGSEEPITPRFLGKTAAREVSVVPATRDAAGAVSGGSITVRGVFLQVVVEAAPKGRLAGVMTRNGESITFNFDRPPGTTSLADRYFCWVVCIFPGSRSRKRQSDTYCLILLRGRPGGAEHICERVGFVDYETRAGCTAMRFFKGYRRAIRLAVIV